MNPGRPQPGPAQATADTVPFRPRTETLTGPGARPRERPVTERPTRGRPPAPTTGEGRRLGSKEHPVCPAGRVNRSAEDVVQGEDRQPRHEGLGGWGAAAWPGSLGSHLKSGSPSPSSLGRQGLGWAWGASVRGGAADAGPPGPSPWPSRQAGPGSGWWVTRRRNSRKALERPRGAPSWARFPPTGRPEARRAAEGAGGGQRRRLQNTRALPASPPALQIVARRPRLGRGAGRGEPSCQPARRSSTCPTPVGRRAGSRLEHRSPLTAEPPPRLHLAPGRRASRVTTPRGDKTRRPRCANTVAHQPPHPGLVTSAPGPTNICGGDGRESARTLGCLLGPLAALSCLSRPLPWRQQE